jgi:WD40 repeat protein
VTRATQGAVLRQLIGVLEARPPEGGSDGQLLEAFVSRRTVYRWDVATGKQAPGWKAEEGVGALAFAPDGKTLAAAGPDQRVRLYRAETGKPLLACEGHRDAVVAVAFAPGGKALASAAADGTVRLWEADSGRQVRARDVPPAGVGGFRRRAPPRPPLLPGREDPGGRPPPL